METASDDWFVDDDLDGVPEIAIGRLPVRTGAQASAIVGKLLGYAGKANLSRGGLFVTDTDEVDLDFSGASTAGEAKVSDIMPVDRFQRGTSGTPDALLAKLGAGPFLVNYLGHGSVEVWDGLLTTSPGRRAHQRPRVDLRRHELPQRLLSRPLHDQHRRVPHHRAARGRGGRVGIVIPGGVRAATRVRSGVLDASQSHIARRSSHRGQEPHHRPRDAPDVDAVRRSDAVRRPHGRGATADGRRHRRRRDGRRAAGDGRGRAGCRDDARRRRRCDGADAGRVGATPDGAPTRRDARRRAPTRRDADDGGTDAARRRRGRRRRRRHGLPAGATAARATPAADRASAAAPSASRCSAS